MRSDEIMQQYSAVCTRVLLSRYLDSYSFDDKLIESASNELLELIKQIRQFNGVNDVNYYHEILENITNELYLLDDESEMLDKIIPKWQELTKEALLSKPIDEFYYEIELFMLLKLIVRLLDNSVLPAKIGKIRAIIRRYSNMPCFWQILCVIDGDTISSAYTF